MTYSSPANHPQRSDDRRRTCATSISQRVAALVHQPHCNLRVESVFADACNVVAPSGGRYSLVSSTIGNGPLNLVLNRTEMLSLIEIGDAVAVQENSLMFGRGWRVDLSHARSWDPMPRYERLAAWPQVVRRNIAWMSRHAAPNSPLVGSPGQTAGELTGAFGSRPAEALVQLQAGQTIRALVAAYRDGDVYHIKTAARRLAGLGPGLTPAGDDWLAGWLVGLRVERAVADTAGDTGLSMETVGKAVLHGASCRTTELSLAFLAEAAAGAVSQAWHQLIETLSNADPTPVRVAAEQIMKIGATSGSDMLSGFLTAFEAAG